MYLFIRRTLALGTALFLMIIQISPLAIAQENLFDTLDDIKQKVEGDTGRLNEKGEKIEIDVVDFSENNPWGSLNNEIINELKSKNITDLNDLAKKAGYMNSEKNVSKLVEYIGNLGFSQLDPDGIPLLDQAGNPLLSDEGNLIVAEVVYKGESQIRSIGLSVIKVIRNIIGSIAVIWIIISAIQMVTANGDETKTTQSRQSILYIIAGLVVILLIEQVVTIIFGAPGAIRGLTTNNIALSNEVAGILGFIRTLIGTLVMLFIIINGFKTIVSQGDEEKIKNERRAIGWSVAGVVVVLINEFIINNIFLQPLNRQRAGETDAITANNVSNLINLMGTVMQFILGFVGLIAFAATVYAGASMILNYGNEEQVQKSRKLLMNALIGIVIILSAFAIVSTLIKFDQ